MINQAIRLGIEQDLLPAKKGVPMSHFGYILLVEDFEPSGMCSDCEKEGIPALRFVERYLVEGHPDPSGNRLICEDCLSAHLERQRNFIERKLKLMFLTKS